jgi:hypothetical protein
VKHLAEIFFWLSLPLLVGVIYWGEHSERVDCRESGGIWNEGDGCDPNRCEVKK